MRKGAGFAACPAPPGNNVIKLLPGKHNTFELPCQSLMIEYDKLYFLSKPCALLGIGYSVSIGGTNEPDSGESMRQYLNMDMLRARGAYKILAFLYLYPQGATVQEIAGASRLKPNTARAYLKTYRRRDFTLTATAVSTIIYSLRPDLNYKDHAPFVEQSGNYWRLTQAGLELLADLHGRA